MLWQTDEQEFTYGELAHCYDNWPEKKGGKRKEQLLFIISGNTNTSVTVVTAFRARHKTRRWIPIAAFKCYIYFLQRAENKKPHSINLYIFHILTYIVVLIVLLNLISMLIYIKHFYIKSKVTSCYQNIAKYYQECVHTKHNSTAKHIILKNLYTKHQKTHNLGLNKF